MRLRQFWLLTDVLDVVSQHHLVEDLTTIHAGERVVHLGLSEGLEGLDIVFGGTIEGRARDSSCWRRLSCLGGSSCALCPLVDLLLRVCRGRRRSVWRNGSEGTTCRKVASAERQAESAIRGL
jgi:hypothetical protein